MEGTLSLWHMYRYLDYLVLHRIWNIAKIKIISISVDATLCKGQAGFRLAAGL